MTIFENIEKILFPKLYWKLKIYDQFQNREQVYDYYDTLVVTSNFLEKLWCNLPQLYITLDLQLLENIFQLLENIMV